MGVLLPQSHTIGTGGLYAHTHGVHAPLGWGASSSFGGISIPNARGSTRSRVAPPYGTCADVKATSTTQNSTLSPMSPMRPQLIGRRCSRRRPSMGSDSARTARWTSQSYLVIHANVKNAHAATATIAAITQLTSFPFPRFP